MFDSVKLEGGGTALDGINLSATTFAVGDKVEVIEGDLQHLIGTVTKIQGETVTIQPHHEDLKVGVLRRIVLVHRWL